MAALTAGRAGGRVVIADEDFLPGGRLNAETEVVGGQSGAQWAKTATDELRSLPNVRLMTRTTVWGAFDHGIFGAVERTADDVLQSTDAGSAPRQTQWQITARRSVLCAGATERMIAFPNNDRPGIMQAGAMRAYANRWAAAAGQSVAIFTNNDDGHRTALDLSALGVRVAAVIDTREGASAHGEFRLISGGRIVGTHGRLGLREIKVRQSDGSIASVLCDALGVSGGWNPNIGLTSHQGCKPVWDEGTAAFVPGAKLPIGMRVSGAAAGRFSTDAALRSGAEAAAEALGELGLGTMAIDVPPAEDRALSVTPFWHVTDAKGRQWIDFQNDVTVKDIQLAHQEGYRSVEHLKRYTTLGMATDQGKTSNLGGLAIMADLTGRSIAETGTTLFRPPYTPVAIGALGGRARDKHFRPTRLTPTHKWADERGAVFVEVGQWLRAQWYPLSGETHWRQSVDREVLGVRKSVGICDVSTLGKIDVQGADAGKFLNFVYCNGFAKLSVGKCRYGLMLREDGFVMDDGTVARFADNRFVVSTTTANAGLVYRHMEFVHQCLRPDLDVQLISVTDAWAQFAVAGPNSRKLLSEIVDPGFDITNDAFPFMACAEITVFGGIAARLFRISFSGELAYELAVPAHYGDAAVRALMQAGEQYAVMPYGTEALGVLRVEKGHPAGNELNGQTSPTHLGMARMVSSKKDSIGAILSQREALVDPEGFRLVGLQAVSGDAALLAGAHLFEESAPVSVAEDQGWVTSVAYSPHIERSIALAFLKRGNLRHGETIKVASPVDGLQVPAVVVSPHFIDPEGERLRG